LGFGIWDFRGDGIGVARFGAMSIDDLWYKNAKRLRVGAERDDMLVEVFDGRHSHRHSDGQHPITLEPYAWRWYRVGAPDNVLDRSDLAVGRHDDTNRTRPRQIVNFRV